VSVESKGTAAKHRQAVLDEIRRLAETMNFELPRDRAIRETDRLVEDLGLDSMTLLALAVAVEDRFRVILTNAPAGALDTIGGLADYVAANAEASP
jgi:acyl carrier protein